MAKKSFPSVKVAGEKRILNARKDTPDIRDRMYEPALIQLLPEIDNSGGTDVLNQGKGVVFGFTLPDGPAKNNFRGNKEWNLLNSALI